MCRGAHGTFWRSHVSILSWASEQRRWPPERSPGIALHSSGKVRKWWHPGTSGYWNIPFPKRNQRQEKQHGESGKHVCVLKCSCDNGHSCKNKTQQTMQKQVNVMESIPSLKAVFIIHKHWDSYWVICSGQNEFQHSNSYKTLKGKRNNREI